MWYVGKSLLLLGHNLWRSKRTNPHDPNPDTQFPVREHVLEARGLHKPVNTNSMLLSVG
jgi:hypothetical protein